MASGACSATWMTCGDVCRCVACCPQERNRSLREELGRSQEARRVELVNLADALARNDPDAIQWVRDHAPEATHASVSQRSSRSRHGRRHSHRRTVSMDSDTSEGADLRPDRVGPSTQLWTRPVSSESRRRVSQHSLSAISLHRKHSRSAARSGRPGSRGSSRGSTRHSGRGPSTSGGRPTSTGGDASHGPAMSPVPGSPAGWQTELSPASPLAASPGFTQAGTAPTPLTAKPATPPAGVLSVKSTRLPGAGTVPTKESDEGSSPTAKVRSYSPTKLHQRESQERPTPKRVRMSGVVDIPPPVVGAVPASAPSLSPPPAEESPTPPPPPPRVNPPFVDSSKPREHDDGAEDGPAAAVIVPTPRSAASDRRQSRPESRPDSSNRSSPRTAPRSRESRQSTPPGVAPDAGQVAPAIPLDASMARSRRAPKWYERACFCVGKLPGPNSCCCVLPCCAGRVLCRLLCSPQVQPNRWRGADGGAGTAGGGSAIAHGGSC